MMSKSSNALEEALIDMTFPIATIMSRGVASIFPGGRLGHSKDQHEKENEANLGKLEKII